MSSLKEQQEVVPSPARLSESLRDTGYTFVSAIADIVDNSVSAGATKISIEIRQEFDGSPILLIGDNGSGMDEGQVESAMMYGSPVRSSPKSLGKFGIGLKTASTSVCRKLTLMSVKNGTKAIRQWDLDVIRETDKWILGTPALEEYQEHADFLATITCGNNGTLVIWENIDRLKRTNAETTTKKQIEHACTNIETHLTGVFYNFLERGNEFPDVDITVNGKHLLPWDPFCRWLNEDGAKRLEVHRNKPFEFTTQENGVEKTIGQFHLNVYILPNKSDLTPAEIEKSRYSLDMQGFHVFREGRMIYSGGWPNRLFVKDPHLNLIRVELLFDHTLDDYFQIDIKKSRIEMPHDLRDTLKQVLTPARHEANRRYRKGSKNSKAVLGLEDQHGKSSTVIVKHQNENTSGAVVDAFDRTKGIANIRNKYGATTIKLKYDDKVDRLVQISPTLQDGVLWEPGLAEGNRHAVFINESHEFYKRFYYSNQENASLIIAMDSLMWSLAEAELSVLSDSVRRNLEDMRISVSRTLRVLAEELPEVDESEND